MHRIGWIGLIGLIGLLAIGGILALRRGAGPPTDDSATQPDRISVVSSGVPSAEQRALVAGNTQFAFNLYRILHREGGNLFFSPYSISMALAMVYSGAYGVTEEQMASVLHFELASYDLAPVFKALHSSLLGHGTGGFQLRLANSLWWQEGYELRQVFLDTVRKKLGATVEPVDFSTAPEKARDAINEWASGEAGQQIKELLPQGALTPLTRLLVANATTFRATWETPFNADYTHDSTFDLLDGRRTTVPLMNQIARFAYAGDEDVQAVELPYEGEQFSMVILLPAHGQFEGFASSLTADRVTEIPGNLSTQLVQIYMPRLEFRSSFELAAALGGLGMTDAFILGRANLSAMADTRELFLGNLYHETIVSVDENGTYAVAATAVDMVGPDVPTVRLNRPFIFLIRDIETGTILFIGQVMNPSEG
jgi:serpin B